MNPALQKDLTSHSAQRRQLRWKIIPSPDEWLRASATSRYSFLDRRGSPEIRAIDAAVENYDRVAVHARAPVGQIWEALVQLFEAIEVYLATPRGHKQPRVDAVRDLRATTMAALSDARWKKLKEVTGGLKPGMKPMVPHVWSEVHSPGHARAGHDPEQPLDPDPWLQGKPGADEKYLFQYLKKVRAEEPNPDNVLYIEDSDRWKYQVVFSETGLACERNSEMGGKILQQSRAITTTAHDNLSTCAYAVDEHGIFYTETSNHNGGTINHCSFLSGRPVMCAGNIGITNGVVGYIDNGSGHYRPNIHNLLRGLKALQDQVSPIYFDAILVRNHAGRYPMAAYLAGKFLATKGHCLPVGYYRSAGPGTHYRRDLVEFTDSSEIPAFLETQDLAKRKDKAAKELNALLQKLELTRANNQPLSGKLNNDEERRIMQTALELDVGGGRAVLQRYYANDQPMLDWEKRRGYAVKIPVADVN